MKRVAAIVGLAVLMVALAAGVALAVLEVGNNNQNTLRGTVGDNKGQDTLFGLGAGAVLFWQSIHGARGEVLIHMGAIALVWAGARLERPSHD